MNRTIAVLAIAFMLTGCASARSDLTAAEKNDTALSEASVGSNDPYTPENKSESSPDMAVGSDTAESLSAAKEQNTEAIPEVNEMKIEINGKEYTAHFADTAAAEEFKAMLPLTLDMSELNGNEKYIYLDSRFTSESENVGYINKGELMLYGSDCIVLFYDSFSTPYSYTRLGYIDDPDGLEKAAGHGSITVTFKA